MSRYSLDTAPRVSLDRAEKGCSPSCLWILTHAEDLAAVAPSCQAVGKLLVEGEHGR